MDYTVKKVVFLNWYYNSDSDQEQEEMRKDLGQHIIDNLIEFGECTVTIDEIFDECSIETMPCSNLEEFDDDDDYLEIGENQCIDLSVDKILLVD